MDEEQYEDEKAEEEDYITLYDDDGNEENFYHLGTVEYKGAKYCVLQLAEPETEEEEDEVAIYKLVGEEPDFVLNPIDDEQLLNEVFDEFCNQYEQYEDDADYADSDEAKKLDE